MRRDVMFVAETKLPLGRFFTSSLYAPVRPTAMPVNHTLLQNNVWNDIIKEHL